MEKLLVVLLGLIALVEPSYAQERTHQTDGRDIAPQPAKIERPVTPPAAAVVIKVENTVIRDVIRKTVDNAITTAPIRPLPSVKIEPPKTRPSITPPSTVNVRPTKQRPAPVIPPQGGGGVKVRPITTPSTPTSPHTTPIEPTDVADGGNNTSVLGSNATGTHGLPPANIYNNESLRHSAPKHYIKTTISKGLKSKRVRRFLVNKIANSQLAPEKFPEPLEQNAGADNDVKRVFVIVGASSFKFDDGEYTEFFTEVPEDYEILITADNDMTEDELANLATAAGGEVVDIEDFDDEGMIFVQLPGKGADARSLKHESDGSISIQN